MKPRLLFLLPVLALMAVGTVSAASQADFDTGLELLAGGNFQDKSRAVDLLVESGDPRTQGLLQSMLDGELYYRKSDGLLVLAERVDRAYAIRDALDGTDLGTAKRRQVKKVSINNELRGQLRTAIASLSLRHPDPDRRLVAARGMLGAMDPEASQRLRGLLDQESDTRVRAMLETAIAVGDLQATEAQARQAAAAGLAESLEPAVRNALMARKTAERDPAVARALADSLARIDARLEAYRVAETVFFGLSLGSVLVLAAIGLAITFGVMGVINMAHGELIMLGAYTTYVVQQLMPGALEWSLLVAVPAAFLVSGLVGILIERGVIRFLYGRPLETLLATFGLSLVLQQLVRSIFSPLNRSVSTPDWMSGSWEINAALSLTLNRLYIIAFCFVVFAGLFLVLRRTRLGLQVRAVSQNRAMARAMGVRSQWVDAITFGLGSGIAGMAGVALSQLTNVGPNLGQAYIVDSFMVVVFGGVGNLWGTLVGGLGLGVANKFLEPWSGAVLAKILILVFIILFIQKRPRGLFPQKGRATEA